MRAMILESQASPLREKSVPIPEPGANQVLIRVHACAVCRTDLHVIDGDLPDPKLPLIPGHQIVGTVVRTRKGDPALQPGVRVGIPWLGSTCGACPY